MKKYDCVKCHTPLKILKADPPERIRCGICGTVNRLRAKQPGRVAKRAPAKNLKQPRPAATPLPTRTQPRPAATIERPGPNLDHLVEEIQTANTPTPSQGSNNSNIGSASSNPKLGPYEVLREIGSGGVGMILKARDHNLKRDVAVKILRPKAHRDKAQRLRFMEEAQITGQLDHPGIAPVHMLGQDADGREFFSMKLVSGRTFEEILTLWHAADQKIRKDFPLSRLLSIFERICETVGFAHARRVLHRDLKPANIMIGTYGEVWVLDWGLAKIMDGPISPWPRAIEKPGSKVRSVREDVQRGLTLTGHTVGTPEYMAPEQACGQDLDERTDLFSLGAILYHMLTGSSPYVGETAQQVLSSAAMGQFTQVRRTAVGRNAPPALAAIVEKCLSKRPAKRYRNAQALVEDLRSYAEGNAVSALPESSLDSIRRFMRKHQRTVKGISYAAMLSLLMLTAVAGWGAHKDRQALEAQTNAARAQQRALNAELAIQGQKQRALAAELATKNQKHRAEIAEVAQQKEKARRLQAELETQKALAASAVKATRRIKAFAPYAQAMDLLLRGQRFDQAEALFNNALAIDSEFAEAQYSLGEVLRRQGKPLQAAHAYWKASKLSKTISGKSNVQALLAAGFAFDGSGMYAEAETVFREAAEVDPLNPLSMVGKVFGLLHQRKLKEGLDLAHQAEKKAPHLWETQFAVGCILYECGMEGILAPWSWRNPALEAMRRSLELDPNQGETLSWLSRILATGTDQERAEALTLSNKAMQMEPSNSNRLFQKALNLIAKNQVAPARATLLQAKKLGLPDSHQLVFEAVLESKTGDPKKAYAAMTKAIHSTPAWPSLMVNRLGLAMKCGKFGEVREEFETWYRNNPHYSGIHSIMGLVYARENKIEAAALEYEKGLRMAPYSHTLLRGLLLCRMKVKQWGPALNASSRLIKVQPENFQNQVFHLKLLTQTKQWAKARTFLQTLEEQFPGKEQALAPYLKILKNKN